MKAQTLEKLETLEARLRKLRGEVKKLTVKQVGRKTLREEADALVGRQAAFRLETSLRRRASSR